MLLEEALAGSGGLSPHDAALALLSFLRDELPAGGAGAERRFIGLFPLIADRVFGEWATDDDGRAAHSPSSTPLVSISPTHPTASSSPSQSSATSRKNHDYRHGDGGWLCRRSPPASLARRRTPADGIGSSPSSSPSASASQNTLEFDPIVRLLRAPTLLPSTYDDDDRSSPRRYEPPTLIDALDAESRRRPDALFGFPLGALSSVVPPLIEDWRECYAIWNEMDGGGGRGGGGMMTTTTTTTMVGTVGKENATRILNLLQCPPHRDQRGLMDHFRRSLSNSGVAGQRQWQQRLGGISGMSPPPAAASAAAYPFTPSRSSPSQMMPDLRTPSHGLVPTSDRGAAVELTMLEYYLFLFVRFPLSNTTWSDDDRPSSSSSQSPCYGRRVYRHLLAGYIDYYLPHGGRRSSFRDHTSELFLRLIVELWIEGPNVAPTTSDAASRRRRMFASSTMMTSPREDYPILRDSLELARPIYPQVFVSPPSQVMDGVLTLVRHLVSDLSLRERVHEVSARLQRRQREEREGVHARGNDGEEANDGVGSGRTPGRDDVPWPLLPALEVVQPSVYNYIRLGLACGSIHDPLETWLAWLEPWQYVLKRRALMPTRRGGGGGNGGPGPGGSAGDILRNAAASVSSRRHVEYRPSYRQPRPTSPSEYDPRWESYVVCNAHFYTVPLAIFLRRARELDFASIGEYPRSLALVQRVLRVYSKCVVNVLNGVLNPRRADALTTLLLERHGRIMNAYCPPTTNWKLSDCQLDVTNLLEELYGQYQKRRAGMDFLERMEARLNVLSVGKMGGDEAALENILSQVRYLVQLPMDYQVLPDQPNVSFGVWHLLGLGSKDAVESYSENSLLSVRGPDGRLTDSGRQQLSAGLCKCDPVLTYIGDPLFSRVKTYEIPALVELTVWISTYLNNKLRLTGPSLSPGVGFDDDDALSKRFREMKQYEKVKLRINLRFLADRRILTTLLVILFALSYERPSIKLPSLSFHRAATKKTNRRVIGGRGKARRAVSDGARHMGR
ncbi:hypothetical protein ACHAXA_006055 [Cyclostephanos tholiformis]|uniref:Sphingomyelin phosphodiesterase 4 n=1 Tax=Cyclostephanos tholiformis TaxID=382380 RepID=A0ABD3SB75_9STRA